MHWRHCLSRSGAARPQSCRVGLFALVLCRPCLIRSPYGFDPRPGLGCLTSDVASCKLLPTGRGRSLLCSCRVPCASSASLRAVVFFVNAAAGCSPACDSSWPRGCCNFRALRLRGNPGMLMRMLGSCCRGQLTALQSLACDLVHAHFARASSSTSWHRWVFLPHRPTGSRDATRKWSLRESSEPHRSGSPWEGRHRLVPPLVPSPDGCCRSPRAIRLPPLNSRY